MRIELDNLMPKPLIEVFNWDSDIWRCPVCFESGKRYQLNAPSGNGKTTLINILCGLRINYEGEWRIDGRAAVSFDPAEWCGLRRRRMAVVFQDLRLLPDLTVDENIRLKTVLTETEPTPTPASMLAELGLESCIEKAVGSLSWGERQRVALVRALSQPFDLLLLDEPFSHLDPGNIGVACDLIDRACRERGAGFIMASLGYDYPLNPDCRLKL